MDDSEPEAATGEYGSHMTDRRALEDRLALARRDLEELDEQVDIGEIDPETAEGLRATYQQEYDQAAAALGNVPQTTMGRSGEAPPHAQTQPRSGRRAIVGSVLVVVALSVAIFFAAQDIAPDATPAGTASSSPGGLSVDPASVSNEQLEAVVAENPDINAMRLALADRYFEAQEYSAALDHYLFIAENNPTPAEEGRALSRIGWMAYVTGQPEAAQQYVQTSLTADPTNDEAKLFLGFILLYGLEDPQGAIPWLEEVAAIPNLPPSIQSEVDQALAEARRAGDG